MGLFGSEDEKKSTLEKEKLFDDIRRKAFNGDPFLLYRKFEELDATFHELFPDIDSIPAYKNYFNTVKKYFSQEGGNKTMNEMDAWILRDSRSKEVELTLSMIGDGMRKKNALFEFKLLSNCFNTIAGLMYSDENYMGPRSYNQYLKDRHIEAEEEKRRIRLEPEQSIEEREKAAKKKFEDSEKFCNVYSNMIIELDKELRATNGFFTRDSKEYKKLAKILQREATLLQVAIPSEDSIKQSLSELSVLADAYIRHVPKNPDSRQKNRTAVCNTIKAVSQFAQKGMLNPRDGLEKMFIKTLVYNENPKAFTPQNMGEITDRAIDIYNNSKARAEMAKIGIVKLVAPTQKNLDDVTQKFKEPVAENKGLNL